MFLSVERLQQVREKKRDCFAPQIVAPYSVKLLFPAAIGPSITIILHKFNMTVLGYVQICTISHNIETVMTEKNTVLSIV